MIQVCFTPGEYLAAGKPGDAVFVIDVLRCTTTVVTAIENGARQVIPVETVSGARETAAKLRRMYGDQNVLLAGERKGMPQRGFDLGNSPREYTPTRVEGRVIVLTTTNGTRAIAAAGDKPLYLAAFTNVTAVVDKCRDFSHPVILCSGTDGRFTLEDACCAGMIIASYVQEPGGEKSDDAGQVARMIFEHYTAGPGGRCQGHACADAPAGETCSTGLPRQQGGFCGGEPGSVSMWLEDMLRSCYHGKRLIKLGLRADLSYCARVDASGCVPCYGNGIIA